MSGHGGVAGEAPWAVLHPLLGGPVSLHHRVALTVVGLLLVSGSSIGPAPLATRHARRWPRGARFRPLTNQMLDERRRPGRDLRTRLAPQRRSSVHQLLACSGRPPNRGHPIHARRLIHQPRFVDGEQTPELSPAARPSAGARPAVAGRRAEETATQLLAAVAAERDDGETLAAFNQLAVRSWSLPDATLLRRNAETPGDAPAAIRGQPAPDLHAGQLRRARKITTVTDRA